MKNELTRTKRWQAEKSGIHWIHGLEGTVVFKFLIGSTVNNLGTWMGHRCNSLDFGVYVARISYDPDIEGEWLEHEKASC
jgi:hypothetical protein